MFPYFLIFPLWFLIAVVWPVLQSCHALLAKGPTEAKQLWLFYWVSFVAMSYFMFFFEWLVSIPFAILSWFLFDIYYEVQLLVLFWLLFPQTNGIKTVKEQLEQNYGALLTFAKEHIVSAVEEGSKRISKIQATQLM